VKYRKLLLEEGICKTIWETLRWIEERYEIEMEQIGYDGDHIDILCSFPPTLSIWEVIGSIKSITAKRVFKTYPEVKKDLWWWEFWTDGYYVSTVWQRWDFSVIEKYIKRQWKKAQDVRLRLF
jgi:putative transposase